MSQQPVELDIIDSDHEPKQEMKFSGEEFKKLKQVMTEFMNEEEKDDKNEKKPKKKKGFFKKLYKCIFTRKKKKKKNIEHDSLDIILSSVYEAVQKAQKSIQLNNINRLEYYFDHDEEKDLFIPKTIRLALPSKEHAGNDEIDVPLFALVHHHSLNISEFTIKLKASLSHVKRNQENRLKNINLHHNRFKIATNLTNISKNTADIELKCTVEEPPEIIARITNRFNKII